MATRDNFVQLWKDRFPGSDPPNSTVQIFRHGDFGDMQLALEKSSLRVRQLQEEIHHEELISSHLREVIKKETGNSKLLDTVSPDDPLDRDVPLLSSTDTLASDHSYTEVSYDNVNEMSSPDAKQFYANDPFIGSNGANSIKPELKPPPSKPVPAPRASTLQPLKERSSVFMMQDISKTVNEEKKVTRGYSLDSKTNVPMRKAPKPPIKPSKESIKKYHNYETLEPFEKNGTTVDHISGKHDHRLLSKKGSDASLTKTSSEESCEIVISPKPDPNISPGFDAPVAPMSTFKPVSKPKASSFSPTAQRKERIISNRSPSMKKKDNNRVNREGIYDEPIPVKEDQVDEASSSDEEPVYYNLMLLKKKQSMDPRLAYPSLDLHKQKLERDAQKLSCRYSVQPDYMKNAKPVRPPMMTKLMPKTGKTIVTGVTEEESSTEQDDRCDSMDSLGELSSMGDRSGSVDSLASGGSTTDESAWRKRKSMLMATAEDSAYSDELSMDLSTLHESDNFLMRKWVVNSILDSEKAYVSALDVLQQYRNSFRAAEKTSQSVISEEDTQTIFFAIPDLHRIHHTFISELRPRVENWTPETQVAELFKILAIEELPIAKDYLNNYQKAIQAVHRCSEDQRFHDLTHKIAIFGVKVAPTLEELLHKPVVRFQRNTLVLHDLINCTPTSHPDYDLLQKTLKIALNFLDNFQAPPEDRAHGESSRYLARYSPIVEQIGTHRKLRHILLFNDLVVCSKQKISGRSKVHHEPKWAIPLLELTLDDKVTDDEKIAQSHRENIEIMQRRVAEYQNELKAEMKKFKSSNEGGRTWSMRSQNKTIEKLRKKLLDQEAALILQSPHLMFRLKNGRNNKTYALLLSSDYERTNWKETIAGLKGKVTGTVNLASIDLVSIINTVKLPKISTGSLIDDSIFLEDEHLFGILNVTIHKLHGLKTKNDVYCCLELDSFGHFFMKAKTRINRAINHDNKEPCWNEAFELDLEGAQTLRILCYASVSGADKLLGKCALELSKAWLRGEFQEKTVPFNEEMSVSVSLGYASRDQTMRRRQSAVKGGVFGQHIQKVTAHEDSDIPLVVTACVQEVEARGFDEVGIYRVSGLSSDIQQLKRAFDKSSRQAVQLAHDMDIHVLTSLLKLYFRDLPEALLTDKLYNSFAHGMMTMSDPEAKENFMIQLIKSLPNPNLATTLYMLDHMLRVSSYSSENKMTLHNLATVFGPTLMRKNCKEATPISIELFSENAKEAMTQTAVLLYLLQLRQSGWDEGDATATKL